MESARGSGRNSWRFDCDHPGLGRSFTPAAFKAWFTAPRVTPSRSATRTSRQSLAVELGRQRDFFRPQASMSDGDASPPQDERDGLSIDSELVCQLIHGVAVFVPRDEIVDLIVS
jgi:hypothetical protein